MGERSSHSLGYAHEQIFAWLRLLFGKCSATSMERSSPVTHVAADDAGNRHWQHFDDKCDHVSAGISESEARKARGSDPR